MRWGALVAGLLSAGCQFHSGQSGDGGIDAPDAPPGHPGGSIDLVFDNLTSGRDLVDFPVLVVLQPNRIDYAAVTDPHTQLRFHDPDTDVDLAFEIEQWNPGALSFVWVKVPTIDALSQTDKIIMFYGTSVAGLEVPANVWTSGFQAVWHLGGSTAVDSTARYSASPDSTTVFPGAIGSAYSFDHTQQSRLDVPNSSALFDGWNQFSFEFWIRPVYASMPLTGEPQVFDNNGGAINNGRLLSSASSVSIQIDLEFTTGTEFLGTTTPRNAWTYVVYESDGSTLKLFNNGIPASSASVGDLAASNGDLFMCHDSNPFNGGLDEIRIASVGRANEWVEAQYRSMQDHFVTFVPNPSI